MSRTTAARHRGLKLPKRFEPVLFGFVLSGLMSFIVSGISTLVSGGALSDWAVAWPTSWAVAFPSVLVAAPIARRIVARVTAP